MKKLFLTCVILCTAFILTVPAFAIDWDDYRHWDEENQCWVVDVFSYNIAKAEEELSQLPQDPEIQPDSEPIPEPVPLPTASDAVVAPIPVISDSSPTKIESAGSKNDQHIPFAAAEAVPDKYSVGSYVDADGIVWSPSGERLSPDDIPAEKQDDAEPPLSDVLDNSDTALVSADSDTLEMIAGLVSDIATDPPKWYVEDLRPADSPSVILEGLKALVTSIFGEYTPVTTTTVLTETVGNDTHQYLVETVAPGAAGVDYEWLAGVFLFGILLFCFMKLLGGIVT